MIEIPYAVFFALCISMFVPHAIVYEDCADGLWPVFTMVIAQVVVFFLAYGIIEAFF